MIPETVVRRANARGPPIVSAICSELRETLNDRVPNDLQVDAEVRVNEHTAHPGDVPPGMPVGRVSRCVAKSRTGLADDLEVPDNRVNRLLVRLKLFDL